MTTQCSPELVAELLPVWLEKEAEYANAKYQDRNPQLASLKGGLLDHTSPAYLECPNYFGRFMDKLNHAEGNERVLLLASQALGKYVSAGRALQRVVLQSHLDVSRQEADKLTFQNAEESFAAQIRRAYPLEGLSRDYMDTTVDPQLRQIDAAINESNTAGALQRTGVLLLSQAQLFVNFTCVTGIIAQPGVNSTDEYGELDHWRISGT